ncbi:hypothetical protein [Longimicrobium terrae]|uniref:Ig-like domain-containing protein n=1 Tax=Longimicrobium terrae TaxID=1639882 RepID=A0A841GMJ9_9BACT|nr:hypothetical protein [Longimicrobium terrae]MBB4635453.1 hypothetical protein [Longimicrobium terrae]MBB6069847.1 hypothetical protein [Longimicrobium terrae]NNC30949.1 hypothetical protein [Longimicrobium terrae]NNC32765.1 hypothetical protein [Longimicrobium terrae]
MRISRFHTLSALLVAGMFATGCGEAPTAAAPAVARRDVTPAPLSVTVYCPDPRDYSTNRFNCTATASGGSGTGYSFVWHSGTEYYDQGGISRAWVPCQSQGYSGYLTAYGVMTDSNGTTQYGYYSRSC